MNKSCLANCKKGDLLHWKSENDSITKYIVADLYEIDGDILPRVSYNGGIYRVYPSQVKCIVKIIKNFRK